MYVRKRVAYSAVALVLLIGLPAILSVTLYKSSTANPSQYSPPSANEGGYYDYTQTLDQVSVVTVDGFATTYGVPLDSAYQNQPSTQPTEVSANKTKTSSLQKIDRSQFPINESGVVIQYMPNGSIKATLPQSNYPTVKAKISKDGSVQVYCSDPVDDRTK